ncbi:MAG: PhzF family phenazine biosynthesis protein [Nitrospira sp.]|nr:PhzF family phenazine biosynthesis protein [Nitrospira sp.]
MADKRTLKFYQADVFTSHPFSGNPVAVFPDAGGLSDDELQKIAREMNLSETVFVFPPSAPGATVKLRIFTPTKEIPFAGHPVVGAMYVLAYVKSLTIKETVTCVAYECNIGLFPVELHVRDGQVHQVVMTQPKPQFVGLVENVEELYQVSAALGLSKSLIVETKWPVAVVSTGLPVLIVPVRTLTAVRSITANDKAITELCERVGTNGVMVFTTMTVQQFATAHARMFAPCIGISEDPATGSAGGALGAYLVQHGVVEVAPTTDMIIEQGYEIERPSHIWVRVQSDDDIIQSVKVGGECVMVAEGELRF